MEQSSSYEIINLSKEENSAFHELLHNKGIVIRAADKGSGIVVLDREEYVESLEKEMEQSSSYEIINFSKEENSAFHELLHNKEIVIRPADKGSGIVVLDREEYVESLEKEMEQSSSYEIINLSKEENSAFHELLHNKEIVIRPADKGSGIVVLDREEYHEENIP